MVHCSSIILKNAVEPRLAAQLGDIARPFGFFVLTIVVTMLAREKAKIPSRFRPIASTMLGSTAFFRIIPTLNHKKRKT
jgi:hypothetical protein